MHKLSKTASYIAALALTAVPLTFTLLSPARAAPLAGASTASSSATTGLSTGLVRIGHHGGGHGGHGGGYGGGHIGRMSGGHAIGMRFASHGPMGGGHPSFHAFHERHGSGPRIAFEGGDRHHGHHNRSRFVIGGPYYGYGYGDAYYDDYYDDAPAYYYSDDDYYVEEPGDGVARCQARYRSFDLDSGTYLSTDGTRRRCPYLG